MVRRLDGKSVDVVALSGASKRPGTFRVTEAGEAFPKVEVIFTQDAKTICVQVPRLMLPVIFASEENDKYVFWDGVTSWFEPPRRFE